MNNFSIRQKILFATMVPVIVLTSVLMWIVYNATASSAESATTIVSYSTLENSKSSLKNYVELAAGAIKPIYDNASANDEDAKKQVINILKNMMFDDGDNHIFIYKYDGMKIASGNSSSSTGKNMMDLKDANNTPIVQDMIKGAKGGGDFYQYLWLNPETESNEPKMSYVIGLDKWGWMIGTDIYLSHINSDVEFLRDQIYEEAQSTFIAQLITALIITVLAAVAGTFLARLIARPIQDMACMMNRISEGDLTPRMHVSSNNEVGMFADSFNNLLNKINEMLVNISCRANKLSDSASNLKNISKQTYEAISEQDQETIAISDSVEEMSTSARGISENGDNVKVAANDVESKTAEISTVVKDNLKSVELLAGEISQAAEAVGAVEKRTDEIQSMLEVIHSVTEQTNLLALNAAIEAARAGEQGRGFAVVADEVRSLAMRSAESAEEIKRIIEGLIEDTQSAVNTMNHSRERSEESLERTSTVANSLTSINEAVQSILQKSADIASATEEQNHTAQEIVSNTTRIKNISTNSADSMKETRDSSNELDSLSKGLLKDINYFTLNEVNSQSSE